MSEKIIQCENITHYYGDKLIYENLNFEVEKGRILGLLGKNGTGKTTIINILNGYLKPHSGTCSIFGEKMHSIDPQTKSRIGLLLEGHVQHNYFNVIQIEKFYSRMFKRWNRDLYFELIQRLQVTQTQKLHTMSCGQRSQVALGLLFAQEPDLLILDDFSMGLDPGYRRLFVEYLRDYVSGENKTVFLTSHIIQDMEKLIDDCMILDYGKILTHQSTESILRDFRRYTFNSPREITIEDDSIKNISLIGDQWECYSFEGEEHVGRLLSPFEVSNLQSNSLSLEDAFIGLTGKY